MKTKRTFPKLAEIKTRNHGIGTFFGSIPPAALFIVMAICYLIIEWGGFWLGYHRFLKGVEEPSSPLETAVTSILGLLAFMLAFTFSLTWSRYANQNGLVIAQAKALLVCYQRTSMLPEKQKTETRRLFYEYINILLQLQTTPALERSLARISELHLLIWEQTASLASEEIDSELRSLFISSVNELNSLALERKTIAFIFRIPDAIWSALLLLAVMGMIAFGYQMGINGLGRMFQMTLLPVAFGLVIALISDLNAVGSQRKFKVTQRPLRDVLELMERDLS
ncbi:DUF4239 domain-containing protein [Flavisolibacter tropicus]|uniref:DUF4239 domain-containing protein n=1 Tax=Flavisolibacter tropicus TaxID=1492898 RepID=A0A172U1E3_9BACT|nr:DUF4239 domain-containing protein [Flavisolibacter tropicus]ANE53171.1 hypothetical protein SY85_24570 [Flavisolibacter tropicus]